MSKRSRPVNQNDSFGRCEGRCEKKVLDLENTVRIFRAEMDMKMRIVEQILNNRNEQFSILKKLLEREETLYQTVLKHWNNIEELAANGLSFSFSEGIEGIRDPKMPGVEEANCKKLSAASIRRCRRQRLRARKHRENVLFNLVEVAAKDENVLGGCNTESIESKAYEDTEDLGGENTKTERREHHSRTASLTHSVEDRQYTIPIPGFKPQTLIREDIKRLVQEDSPRISFFENLKGTTSAVWTEFKIVKVDNIQLDFVVCNQCKVVLSYKSRTGTGALFRHLPCGKPLNTRINTQVQLDHDLNHHHDKSIRIENLTKYL